MLDRIKEVAMKNYLIPAVLVAVLFAACGEEQGPNNEPANQPASQPAKSAANLGADVHEVPTLPVEVELQATYQSISSLPPSSIRCLRGVVPESEGLQNMPLNSGLASPGCPQ